MVTVHPQLLGTITIQGIWYLFGKPWKGGQNDHRISGSFPDLLWNDNDDNDDHDDHDHHHPPFLIIPNIRHHHQSEFVEFLPSKNYSFRRFLVPGSFPPTSRLHHRGFFGVWPFSTELTNWAKDSMAFPLKRLKIPEEKQPVKQRPKTGRKKNEGKPRAF